jgi:hypothetical protein
MAAGLRWLPDTSTDWPPGRQSQDSIDFYLNQFHSKGIHCSGVKRGQSKMRVQSMVISPQRPGTEIDCSANYRPVVSSDGAPDSVSRHFWTKREKKERSGK